MPPEIGAQPAVVIVSIVAQWKGRQQFEHRFELSGQARRPTPLGTLSQFIRNHDTGRGLGFTNLGDP